LAIAALPATVNAVEPETNPDLAIINAVPDACDEAKPLDPVVLLIKATEGVEEVQMADMVRFCIVLSVYVPVAVNCSVVPTAILESAGATVIETNATGVTVSCVDCKKPP